MPIGKHNYRRFQKCITWPCSVTSFLPNGQNVGHQLDLNFRIVKREKPARTSCERTLTTTTRSPLELIIAELKVYSPFCCVTMKNISILTFFLLIYCHNLRVKLLWDENNTATDQPSIEILNKMEEKGRVTWCNQLISLALIGLKQ